ncbi:MAG TPA: hypothetical protein VNI01_16130, partial [Elusimicrobiota bacterium]|nr:hypothetical protein [Elusimicrobiota bacterium]
VEIRNIGGRVYVAASADLNGSRTVNFTDLTLLAEQMRVVPSQTESGQFNLDSEVLTRSNAGGFNFGDKTTTSAIKDYNLFIHVLTQAGLPSGIEQAVGTLLNTSRFSGGSIFGSSVPPRITMQTTDNRTVSLEHRDGAWTQPDAERDNALGGTMPGATGRNGGASRIVMDPRNGTRFTDAEALTELARTNWRFQSDGNDLPTTRVEGVGGTRAALFRVQDGDQIYYVVRYLEAVTADRTTVRVLRLPVTATNGAGVTVTDLPWPTGDRLTRLQPLFNTHTRTFLVPIPGTNASSGGWVAFVGDPGGNLESPSGGAICRGVVVSWGSPTIPTPCR